MQVDDSLVDPHLEPVPSLGTFTTRCFTGGDPQDFGWHTYGTFHAQFLFLGGIDQVGTYLFQRTYIARS